MKSLSLYLWHDRHYFTATLFLYVATFVIILPHICRTWNYSKFFRSERNAKDLVRKALELNDQRLVAADLYFSSLKSKDPKLHLNDFKKSVNVEIAIGIISVSRLRQERDHHSGRQGYLTQSAAALHRAVSDNKHRGGKVAAAFICNVDIDGESHREALELSRYLSTVQRFSNHTKNLSYIRTMDVFEKEKSDYSFCIEQALSVKPRYVLLLEDDVLVKEHLLETVRHLLSSYVTASKVRQDESTGSPSPPWLFLKLYYPEKWQGYGNELPKILELISIGILGGSLFAIIFYIFASTSIIKSRDGHHWRRMFAFFTLGALYLVVAALVIGRPHIHHLRGISLYMYRVIDAPDCCTQAIVYPAAAQLVNYLDTVRCTSTFSIDLTIDYFAMKNNLKRYLVEPNIVSHIGMISTVRSFAKSAADFIF